MAETLHNDLTARLRRTAGRSLRAAQRRAAAPGFESKLVWVFGSPRSGSTWLLQLLHEHDAVMAVNEPLIGLYLGPFLCDQPGFELGGLDVSNFTLRRVQSAKRDQFFAEQFAEVWQPLLGRLLRERFLAQLVQHPP